MLPATSGERQDSWSTYFSNAGFSDAVQSGIAAMQTSLRALHHQSRFASLACRQHRQLVNPLNPFQTRNVFMSFQPGTFWHNNTCFSYCSNFNAIVSFPQQQIPIYDLNPNLSLNYQDILQNSPTGFISQINNSFVRNVGSRFEGIAAVNQITEMAKRKRSHSDDSMCNQSKTEPSDDGVSKKKCDNNSAESNCLESKEQKHRSDPNRHRQSIAETIVTDSTLASTDNKNPTLTNTYKSSLQDALKTSSTARIWTESHRNCTPSPPGCSSAGQRQFSTTTQSDSGKSQPPPSDWTHESNSSTSRPLGADNRDSANFPLPPGKNSRAEMASTNNKHPRDGTSSNRRGRRIPRDFRRHWKDTKLGRTDKKNRKKAHKRGLEFVVMSYNLLAQNLIHMNDHLYRHCSSDILDWNYRKCNLIQEIADINADVVCLQEVQGTHYQDFYEPEMKQLGYIGLFKQRTGDKRDGCATFYKGSRFDLVNLKLLEYRLPGIQMLNRDNVAVVVLLQPKGQYQSERLCITNTHLLYNPKRGDIKLAQLSMLLAEVDKMAYIGHKGESTYHPVIMCGDFNSVPDCPLVEFIQTGRLDYEGMRTIDVSGQERWRSSKVLECPLWPGDVGVTDKCQYNSILQRRQHHNPATAAHLPPVLPNDNSNSSSACNTPSSETRKAKPDFSSRLKHRFQFDSAYPHHDDCREVTTNHCRANSKVDYIFYARGISQLDVFSRLTLFTDRDAEEMGGLPNERWSSDHFSLAVRFLLTPNDVSAKR